jgi:tetratricopeptide (TPR) repeat protein
VPARTATLSAAARSGGQATWIENAWIDLLVGCGGWSIPLLLVSYTLVERDVPRWSAVFYALALVFNYPHYMATIYRAYGRADRGRHRLYTHYLTGLLVVVAMAAHVRFALVPWLFTTYVMWSPWHYTGQNFGLLMMFLRRAGIAVTDAERRALHTSFVASYVMLLAAFNQGPSHDPLILSLGLPLALAQSIEFAGAIVFVGAAAMALVAIARRTPARTLIAPLTLCSTQALWFAVPLVLAAFSSLAVPQTRYSSGMVALMHSAQYLWITRYFARRDAEQSATRWSGWAWWITVVAGGMALFLPIPWLVSYGWHADFTQSVFIVAATVNIHHFMVDGVVWKLRSARVGQVLVGAGRQASGPATDDLHDVVPARWRSWRAVAVAGLAALAVLDQWRYGLAVGHTDPVRLVQATALNPYDTGVFVRLAQADRGAGNAAGAEAALRRAIVVNPQNPAPARALVRLLVEHARWSDAYTATTSLLAHVPRDVDALVNAGVLAHRLGRTDAAEDWWRRALAIDPGQAHVHLYLAELLAGERRSRDAVTHYRAYLERVARSAPADRPAPAEVGPAVVRFGDALAAAGDPGDALSQYDLATRIASQTGQSDLETLARSRREALSAK